MNKYRIESNEDGNVFFEVEAKNREDAFEIALEQLGYSFYNVTDEDEEQ